MKIVENLCLVRQNHGPKYGSAQRYGSLKMATTGLLGRIFRIENMLGVSRFILSIKIFAKSNLSFYQKLSYKKLNKIIQ